MGNIVENMHTDFRAERVNLEIDWHPTQWELKAEYRKTPRNSSFTDELMLPFTRFLFLSQFIL